MLDRMAAFADRVRSGRVEGPHRASRSRNIVNIGIGGSDLGPVMAYEALRHYSAARSDVPLRLERRRHRLRRGDARPRPGGDAVHHLLEDVHDARDDDQRAAPRATGSLGDARATRRRSRSTSSRSRRTPRRSRSSASTPRTCSASGTGSAAATRWTRRSACRRCSRSARTQFREMLAGFHAMDEHFRTAPLEQNLPVLMGLLGVWYADFFGAADGRGAAVRPVPEAVPGVPAAADDGEQRQARHARRRRRSTTRPAPIYWGEPGTNGQHSFYQLIHQGTQLIPCDFIALQPGAEPARATITTC